MLKIKLKAKKSILYIEKYEITGDLFSRTRSLNDKNVFWTLDNIKCKQIRGNFRLLFRRKIDFSGITHHGEEIITKKMTIINKNKATTHDEHIFCTHVRSRTPNYFLSLLYSKRFLFLFNEKNHDSDNYNNKRKLPFFLLTDFETAKKEIQFFIIYENEDDDVTLESSEEITFCLNLSEK